MASPSIFSEQEFFKTSGPAGQYSDEHAAAVQRYKDEVESAERLRRAQEQDRYFSLGARPPVFLSEFAPPTAAQVGSQRPQYLKSGQDWYRMNAGQPELVVDAPEPNRTPARVIPRGKEGGVQVPEGFTLVPYGTEGYTIERKPTSNQWDFLGQAGGGEPSIAVDQAFQIPATKAPRKAIGGYKIGSRYRGLQYIGGDPLDETSWQK